MRAKLFMHVPICCGLHAGDTKHAVFCQVIGDVDNFYLNQVIMDLGQGDFNLTDLLPNGIVVSDPVFFNNGATNVSGSTQASFPRQAACLPDRRSPHFRYMYGSLQVVHACCW